MGSSIGGARRRVERAVLALLLALDDSGELTIEEIVHEMGDQSEVMRALAKLQDIGLVERVDGSIRPTPAARRFDELNI